MLQQIDPDWVITLKKGQKFTVAKKVKIISLQVPIPFDIRGFELLIDGKPYNLDKMSDFIPPGSTITFKSKNDCPCVELGFKEKEGKEQDFKFDYTVITTTNNDSTRTTFIKKMEDKDVGNT